VQLQNLQNNSPLGVEVKLEAYSRSGLRNWLPSTLDVVAKDKFENIRKLKREHCMHNGLSIYLSKKDHVTRFPTSNLLNQSRSGQNEIYYVRNCNRKWNNIYQRSILHKWIRQYDVYWVQEQTS